SRTVAVPVPLAARTDPANAFAVTVCATPAGTSTVPSNVPSARRVSTAAVFAGVTFTDTSVICAPAICAATVTRTNPASDVAGALQAQRQSAMKALRTAQGTGRTTTNRLSVSVWRVSVAVTRQTSPLAAGVQVAVAVAAFAAKTRGWGWMVPPQESESAIVPVGHGSKPMVTRYGVPFLNGVRIVASLAVRATDARTVAPLENEIDPITGCGT